MRDGGTSTDKYCYGVPWIYLERVVHSNPVVGQVTRVEPFRIAWWHAPWHGTHSHIYIGGLAANMLWWGVLSSCCWCLTSARVAPQSGSGFQVSLAQALLVTTVAAMLLSVCVDF